VKEPRKVPDALLIAKVSPWRLVKEYFLVVFMVARVPPSRDM
jgi:hypothetical protein